MMETIKWSISGINCDGCSVRLQKVLPGKKGCTVGRSIFCTKKTLLEDDSVLITADKLKQAV